MQEMKKAVILNGKAIFDIYILFARLLVGGHQRIVEVTDIFQYELSHVPPSLIDEFGCLRNETANDHERIRRAGTGPKDFHLTPNTPLTYREAILENSKNKSLLASILCGYPIHNNVQLVKKLDCLVTYEEADIALCRYMLDAAACCAHNNG